MALPSNVVQQVVREGMEARGVSEVAERSQVHAEAALTGEGTLEALEMVDAPGGAEEARVESRVEALQAVVVGEAVGAAVTEEVALVAVTVGYPRRM
jgi:hypothetical protein